MTAADTLASRRFELNRELMRLNAEYTHNKKMFKDDDEALRWVLKMICDANDWKYSSSLLTEFKNWDQSSVVRSAYDIFTDTYMM